MALRAWSAGGARSGGSRAIEAAGLGHRLDRRRRRPRPRLPLHATPTATSSSSTTRPSATSRRPHLRPSLKNQPQRYTGRGAAVKRLDHVNLLAADVRACREFCDRRARLPATTSGSCSTTAREAGAWMSLTIAAHELIYTPTPRHARAGCTTSRSGSTRARSACARPTSSSRTRSRSRSRRRSTTIARASSSTASSPAATAIEVTTGGYFVYDPGPEPVLWTEAERAKGQAWGVQDGRELPHYGTPPVEV